MTRISNTSTSSQQMFEPKQPSQDRSLTPSSPGETAKQWLAVVKNQLEGKANDLSALLPTGYTPQRFIMGLDLYLRNHPELFVVSPITIVREALKAAQQGLDFGMPNEAHLVGYGLYRTDGKPPTVSLIRGYKGDLKLARRSASVGWIDANVVYENEEFEVSLGSDVSVRHKPVKFGSDKGKPLGFYAVAKDRGGNVCCWVMDNSEVWKHAKRFTKATKKGPFAGVTESGPAAENWEAYGLKTVIIALCTKKLDLTSEMAQTLADEYVAMADSGKPTPAEVLPLNDGPSDEDWAAIKAESDARLAEEMARNENEAS